jgi:uncharacterized protein (TIGR02996 family)
MARLDRPEVRALLHAAKETPEDDLPRLVLADWLEEHGQPERADFIRLQCSLAALTEEEAHQEEPLWARQEALRQAHGSAWGEPFGAPGEGANFSRGLLRLQLSGPHLLTPERQELVGTESWAWVEALRFERLGSAAEVAASPALAEVVSLDLSKCRIGDEGGRALGASPYLGGPPWRSASGAGGSAGNVAVAAAAPTLAPGPRRSPAMRRPLSLACLLLAAPLLPAGEDALSDLLKKLPASDRATAEALSKELVKGGRKVVDGLVARLGGKEDAKARYALHGLALYTSRPGAGAERKAYSSALAAHLARDHPTSVKAFLLQQLQYAGGPEAVAPIAKLLTDEKLCEPATQALVRLRSADALRAALPKVGVKNKVTLVQALGTLRDRKALDALLGAAADKDPAVRLAALVALADVGDARAARTLLEAVSEKPSYERAKVVDACLTLASRLDEAGRRKEARAFLDRLRGVVKDKKGREPIERLRAKLASGEASAPR